MYVRFRQTKTRLQASLIQARRGAARSATSTWPSSARSMRRRRSPNASCSGSACTSEWRWSRN